MVRKDLIENGNMNIRSCTKVVRLKGACKHADWKISMKMYRRLMLGVATAALGILLFGMTVFAETTGTIIPASAKIRAEANTSSTVIASVTSGKTISITDEVTGDDGSTWYQVFVDASTKGFIRSDLVQKSTSTDSAQSTTTTTQTPSTTSVTAVDNQSCKVSVTSAKVRKNASTSADMVASVSRGTALTVTGKATGDDGKEWYQISFTYNNQSYTGFIRSDLVTFGELEEEAPAVTEVEGTTASDTDETATEEQAATDTESAEGTVSSDTVAQKQTTEETQQPQTPVSEITILTTEETPPLPDGFTEVAVTLNDQAVRAWKNGDFYIFYGQSSSGSEGFYMYDSAEVTYQRYYMSNVIAQEESDGDGSIYKTLVIVLGVVVVLLLVLVTILAIKMNDYRSELEWDDDDDDDEDEDEDEIEDDEEDDEEEEVRPVRKTRPVKKPLPTQRDSKPRNFLEVEEEVGQRAVKKTVHQKSIVDDDFDPDDEDTFVFINLDGDEID